MEEILQIWSNLEMASKLQLQLEAGWITTGLQNGEMQPGWSCSQAHSALDSPLLLLVLVGEVFVCVLRALYFVE